MALVPFRVSGRAADQAASTRTFQIGPFCLIVRQIPQASNSLAPACKGQASKDAQGERLENVGLVVWQSAFVLADWLLRHPPFGQWDDVTVVELGCGTGVTGIALGLAGAHVTLTDREHVLHLTRSNVEANCVGSGSSRVQVSEYEWGTDSQALGEPDVIVGADVVYQRECYPALARSLAALSSPHTVCFIAFRSRGRDEEAFQREVSKHHMACTPVPHTNLHEEYADGTYHILRICHLG